MSERIEDLQNEYQVLCHAMQTGVKFDMETWTPQPGNSEHSSSPKHLRTGVNSALCDSGALGDLLVQKGIITEEEYWTAVRDKMKAEVEGFEELLSKRVGKKIHLL